MKTTILHNTSSVGMAPTIDNVKSGIGSVLGSLLPWFNLIIYVCLFICAFTLIVLGCYYGFKLHASTTHSEEYKKKVRHALIGVAIVVVIAAIMSTIITTLLSVFGWGSIIPS